MCSGLGGAGIVDFFLMGTRGLGLQGRRVRRLGQSMDVDCLGGKKRVLVPFDHRFRVMFLCNFQKEKTMAHLHIYREITVISNHQIITLLCTPAPDS